MLQFQTFNNTWEKTESTWLKMEERSANIVLREKFDYLHVLIYQMLIHTSDTYFSEKS